MLAADVAPMVERVADFESPPSDLAVGSSFARKRTDPAAFGAAASEAGFVHASHGGCSHSAVINE